MFNEFAFVTIMYVDLITTLRITKAIDVNSFKVHNFNWKSFKTNYGTGMGIQSHRRLRRRFFSKKSTIVAAMVVAAILISTCIYLMMSAPKKSTGLRSEKHVAPVQGAINDDKLDKGGVKLTGTISNTSAKDRNTLETGDRVKVRINLQNTTNQQARFLTIKTSLERADLFDIQNYKGFNGLSSSEGRMEINNVVVRSQQTQDMSFDAVLYPPDGKSQVSMKVMLVDAKGKVVASSSEQIYKISSSKHKEGV